MPGTGVDKPRHWVASAKKDYLSFPIEVQDEMGYALGLAQLGDTFRAIYTVRFADAVYVLHAFQKKSKSGIKTDQTDVTLIAERLKRARIDYESGGTS